MSPVLESSPDPQCGAIIEKYKDRFLGCIDARAIARKLEIEEVIPNRVSYKIENSAPEDANDLLFLHLRSHSSLETLHKLCDVMIGMSGYPKINKLGRLVKDDLTTVSCVSESSEHFTCSVWFIYPFVSKVHQYVHHIYVCVHVYKVNKMHLLYLCTVVTCTK